MSEALVVDEWLAETLDDATLLAAATGGVWADEPPAGTVHPFVVWQLTEAAQDVRGIAACRLWVPVVFMVKAVDKATSYAGIEAAANRVDALLHGASQTDNDRGTMLTCVRERVVRYPETVSGESYRHLGGLYRIEAQEG